MPVLSQIYHHVQPLSLTSIHSCVCVHCFLGGLQTDLPDLPEGWLFQFVEGKLGHHGSSHPVCCYSVLRPWAVQGAAGRLLWLSGQVSVRSLENHLQLDLILYFSRLNVFVFWVSKLKMQDCAISVNICFFYIPECCHRCQGYWLGRWLAPRPPCLPIRWIWCGRGWL